MAAQGVSKEGTFCERCFAHVAKGEAYCPECGAPTGEAVPAAESAVHGELAQANLLRLRGDLEGSEKALLAILRRFPNDPHAHEMLGDVCADRSEGERAVEWYELALDLAPNTPDVRRKLQETRDRIDARDTADTAAQIGLPPATPPVAWWPLAGSAAILALAVLVVAWPRRPAPAVYRASVVAPASEVTTVASNTDAVPEPAATTPTSTPIPTPTVSEAGAEEDRRIKAELAKGEDGAHVQGVALDPRGTLSVTFEAGEADDPKALALALGKAALAAAPTATTASLRAVRGGVLVFAADLARTGMDASDPLTNVWPAPAPEATAPAPSSPPATGTTPAGTGAASGTAAPPAGN